MLIKNLEFNEYRLYRAEIRSLLVDSYRDDYDLSEEQLNLMVDKKLASLDDYIRTNAFIIGAIDNHNLIGFTWIYQYNDKGQDRFHFNEIVVSPHFRGLGIGKELQKKSLQVVREKGVDMIDLMVAEDNRVSRNLTEKEGFKTNKRYLVKRLKD